MSIFHLHIPRTSGGNIRETILRHTKLHPRVIGHYRTLSNQDFKKAELISGHYGITPAKYSKKIFTVIRDPNELTFSYIKYLALLEDSGGFSEDHLKRYLYEEGLRDSVTNVIAKFLSLELDIPKYNSRIGNLLNMANNSWYLQPGNVSTYTALASVEKYNIKIFTYREDMNISIANYLDIPAPPYSGRRINSSGPDRSNLYEKYFLTIQEANAVDINLYEKLRTL